MHSCWSGAWVPSTILEFLHAAQQRLQDHEDPLRGVRISSVVKRCFFVFPFRRWCNCFLVLAWVISIFKSMTEYKVSLGKSKRSWSLSLFSNWGKIGGSRLHPSAPEAQQRLAELSRKRKTRDSIHSLTLNGWTKWVSFHYSENFVKPCHHW